MFATPKARSPLANGEAGTWQRLKALAVRDTNVVVAAVVLNNLLRAISSIILTRLLVPEVFGIAGVIASIQFTVALASDLGFQAFVVRHADGEKPRFLDTVWTISLIRALLLTLLLAVLAEPLSAVFDKPELAPIVAVAGLTFVIEGLASVSLLSAVRNRMVLRLSVLELIVLVAQIAATVVLAYLWRSYWAILVGLLSSGMLKTVLSYTMFANARRRIAWEPAYARDLWAFARFVTGSSLIYLVLAQCDKLVLARVMPLDEFGFYILAGNLATAPLAFAGAYASRVLYPFYAELWRQQSATLRQQFYAKRRLASMFYALATGGIIGSAPLIIGILYDDRYAGAALYLQILAITPLLALASNSANETLTATGRISVTFQASAIKLVWLIVAGTSGYVWGGPFGLVLAVGLMEIPALLLKWAQMHRAGLLDARQELLFLAIGGAGVLCGFLMDAAAAPLLN